VRSLYDHTAAEAATSRRSARLERDQHTIFKPAEKYVDELKGNLENAGILFEENELLFPNIISSYVGEDVF
jgi:hypothetical protein